jgi:hypothetical protein
MCVCEFILCAFEGCFKRCVEDLWSGKLNKETKIGGKHTLKRVNSSNIRLFFVARSTSRLLPCCAFALSAFGFGRCTLSSSSSGLDQSSSGSRPANSTYYHGVDTMRMTHERKAHLQNLQFSLHLVVICVCFEFCLQSVHFCASGVCFTSLWSV